MSGAGRNSGEGAGVIEWLADSGVVAGAGAQLMPDAPGMVVGADQWRAAFAALAAGGWRFATLWAQEHGPGWLVTAVVEAGGRYATLRAELAPDGLLPSIADIYPGAGRLERHAADLLGVALRAEDGGAPRRWTRHAAWNADAHPLRSGFPRAGIAGDGPTPADTDYPFASIAGSGVYEIPVGPVHAGIIEPGHFRFQAVGESVLNLEARLGYLHRGVEKIAVGRAPPAMARLASRISGDTAVGHAWAACQAMERAAGQVVPERVSLLRALLAEVERIVNHLWDIAAVCNDVGYAFAYYQFGRLVENWRRLNADLFGHRLLMDCVIPGGVGVDPDVEQLRRLQRHCGETRGEVHALWDVLQGNASLHDRLAGTGVLQPDDARRLGALGFVGRASGRDFDVRRDAPYAPYEQFAVVVPCLPYGDVAARVRLRHDEIDASLDLLEALIAALGELPRGDVGGSFEAAAGGEGLGVVEGWRGEIITYVRFSGEGRIERFFARDPSWFNWLALEVLIKDNIVPDFPVCNKSINGSYAGCDL